MLHGQKSLGLPVCRHNQNRNCYSFMSLHGLPLVFFPYSNNAHGSSWFISCAGLPPDSLGFHCRDPPTSLKKKKKIYLFLAVLGPCCCEGFSLAGTLLWLGCSGFCHCGARALGMQASVIVARGLSSCSFQALECQLNICGEQALLLHSIWDLPRSGVKPVSPALTGRLFTTEPPGKPSVQFSRSVVSDSLWPHGLQHARLPVHYHLPEFAQTHVHWVSDAIQPSHPLLSPSPPAFNLSQHHGLFQWVSSSHQVVKILELQHQSFQWIFGIDFL